MACKPHLAIVTCKAYHGDDIRRFELHSTSFESLIGTVFDIYGFQTGEDVTIKYEDEDGDSITISCDNDLELALQDTTPLRLLVTTALPEARNDSPRFQASPRAPNRTKTTPKPVKMQCDAAESRDERVPIPEHEMEPEDSDESSIGSEEEYLASLEEVNMKIAEVKRDQARLRLRAKQLNMERKLLIKERKNKELREKSRGTATTARERGTNGCVRKYVARFISHVTAENGTVFRAGSAFTKTWRLMNVGRSAWPTATKIVSLRAYNLLSAPKNVTLNKEVLPGETTNVSIPLMAPLIAGSYTCSYQLSLSGRRFGPRLMVKIVSELDDASSSTSDEDEVSESEIECYEDQFSQLCEMGFKVNKTSMRLLKQHNGNIQAVVKILVERKLRRAGLKVKSSHST